MADGRVEIDVMLDDGKAKKGVKDLDRDLKGLDSSGKRGALGIGKIVTALGLVALGAKAISLVRDSIQKAFGRIDTMEQFERVMTTMTGSSEKANEVLGNINETVKGTAYGLDIGAKAVQSFVTSNMDVDKATMTFKAWSDAVSFYGDGTNETLSSVTDALAKASAKGKIQMDTMNRLAEAGVPAMQIYADATGKSVEQVADEMSKGKIDAASFIDVMNDAMVNGTKNFAGIDGAAKEAGASWTGTFDNMRAAVTRGVVHIIQKIDEMLVSNGLPDMREMVAMFGRKFEEVLNRIGEIIPVVIEKILSIWDAFKPFLPIIASVVTGVLTFIAVTSTVTKVTKAIGVVKKAMVGLNTVMMANPVALIIAAIVGLAVLIYFYWDDIKAFTIRVWNAIKDFMLGLWDQVKENFNVFVEWIKLLFETLKNFFIGLWEGIKNTAKSIWDSIVSVVMGIVQPFIDGFMNIFNNMRGGIEKIFGGFKKYFEGIWEAIKNVFLGAILLIIDLVTGNFDDLKKNAQAIWENLKDAFGKIWDGIKDVFSGALEAVVGFFTGAWENIKSNITAAWDFIVDLFFSYLDWVQGIFTDALDFIMGFLESAWDFITGIWEKALDFILKGTGDKFTEIKDNIQKILNNIWGIIKDVWEYIKKSFKNAVDFVKALVTLDFGKMKDIIKNQMQLARDTISRIWDRIKTIFSTLIETIKTTVKQKFQDIVNSVKGKMNDVKKRVQDGWNNAVKFLKDIDLKQIGRDIIQGLINGIKSKVKAVGNAVKDVTSQITNKIKDILKISSPSQWMRDMIGKNMMLGWEVGIESEKGAVMRKSEEAAGWMIPDVSNFDNVITKIRKAYEGLGNGELKNTVIQKLLVPSGTFSGQSNTNNNNNVTHDNRQVHIEVDASNLEELEQVIEMFTGLKQTVRKG